MNERITPMEIEFDLTQAPTYLDAWAKRAVRRLLAAITWGQIQLSDGREILYFDNALSPDDLVAGKARELRKERLRLLKELRIVPDKNADGVADADPVKITKLYRA